MLLVLEGHRSSPETARDLAADVWHPILRGLVRAVADAFDLDGPGEAARAERLARFALACFDGIYFDVHVDPEGTDIAAMIGDLGVALEALARTMSEAVR